MPNAFDIVMQQRKELVDMIVGMMEKDGFFLQQAIWNGAMLCPTNPLSNVTYKGGNRLRLMAAVWQNEYKDPRWATARQYAEKGYYIRKGEKGIPCEKWIFTKEKVIVNENQEKEVVEEELKKPRVSYFTVFNAQQVEGFPEYSPEVKNKEIQILADQLIDTSECPVKEIAQGEAFYAPGEDVIVLPPREYFKDEESFVKTLLHEMSHSTGHPARLHRTFGSHDTPEYAMEELRAELGALFTETDLGVNLKGEHYEDHSDYLKGWISVLKNDPTELFRACADAQKISERLIGNYCRKYELTKQEQSIQEYPQKESVVQNRNR